MSVTNFPNGMTSFGMPLVGMSTGNVYFVDDSGSNDNVGTDSDHPFAGINYAVGRCTASKGDVIFVMPGHSEAITAVDAIDIDVAGVSIIGLGNGTDQPRIDYTLAAGEVIIGAASVLIQNINFHANVPEVLKGIDIEAAGTNFTIKNCRFDVETTGTDEFMYCINVVAGASNGLIEDNYMNMGIGNASAGILLEGASVGIQILRNKILGDFTVANINGTGAISTTIDIGYNILTNGDGGNLGTLPCIAMYAGTDGIIFNNYLACNVATKAAAMVGNKCMNYHNYYNEDVTGTNTAGIIGTAFST
jgi:hypothetical protein